MGTEDWKVLKIRHFGQKSWHKNWFISGMALPQTKSINISHFFWIIVCIFAFIIYLNIYSNNLEQHRQEFSQEHIPKEVTVTIVSDIVPGNTSQKCAIQYASYKIMATIYSIETLECGDQITVQYPKTRALERNKNFDIQTYDEYLLRQGYVGAIIIKHITAIQHPFSIKRYIYRAKRPLINSIKKTLSPAHAATMCTLLFGTSAAPLDTNQTTAYRQAGIIHLLVVSGSQIAILTTTLQVLLRSVPPIGTFWIVSIFNLLFTIMTGAGPSIVRACLITEVALIAPLVERKANVYRSLFTSCIIMVLISPLTIFDVGFQLSVLATFALVDTQPRLQTFFGKENTVNKMLTTSLAPLLLTTPICVYYFQGISLAALPLNILILPWVEMVVVSGFVASIVGSILPPLGFICNLGNELFLTILDWLVKIASTGYMHVPAIPLLTLLGIYIAIYLCLLRRMKQAILAAGIGFGFWWYIWNTHPLTVTVLDVGQGDSIYISTAHHKTILIDCGSDTYNAGPVAQATIWHETGKLDYLIITHDHTDHMNGVKMLSIPIANRISGNILIGETLSLDGAVFTLFQDPYPLDTNGESIVTKMQYHNTSMLFTGDATTKTEEYLLQNNIGACDVLKVGHHGSKTSSGHEFLAQIQPKICIISVGHPNHYGHPHKEILARLQHISPVYRTDYDGAVRVQFFTNGTFTTKTPR